MLPKFVVAGMRDEIVPRGNFVVEVFCVGVGERTKTEIPVVEVEAIEGEAVILGRGFEQRGVFERVAETKRAVVEEVVAEISVAHARLFGRGFERWMRI